MAPTTRKRHPLEIPSPGLILIFLNFKFRKWQKIHTTAIASKLPKKYSPTASISVVNHVSPILSRDCRSYNLQARLCYTISFTGYICWVDWARTVYHSLPLASLKAPRMAYRMQVSILLKSQHHPHREEAWRWPPRDPSAWPA